MPGRGRRPRGRRRSLALVATLLALLIPVLALVVLAGLSDRPHGLDPSRLSQATLEEKSGARVVRVAVTAGGGMVELSYQVVDPDKTIAIHDPKTPPALVDEVTHRVVNRLFMGHMPHGPVSAGVTYYLLFENYDHAIRPGRSVTVELGGGRLEHVVVW